MLSLLCISKDLLIFGLMKRAFIVVSLILWCVPGYCQFFQKIDNWLRQRQSKQVYDTTYIYRPQEKWLVRTKANVGMEGYTLGAAGGEIGFAGYGLIVANRPRYKHSIGGGYRHLTLDIGFTLFGKQETADFALNIYGNRLGLMLEGSLTSGLMGAATAGGNSFKVNPGTVAGIYGQVKAYYAFNGGRFSLPAAVTQAYRQRRSAGSLLALVSAGVMPVIAIDDEIRDKYFEQAVCAYAGAGLGYGYNWVPSQHWLVHACLTETVGIWNGTSMRIKGIDRELKRHTPIFVTTGSVSLLYYYRKWYFGAYGTLDSLLFMGEDDASMLMGRLKSSANLTAGIRF